MHAYRAKSYPFDLIGPIELLWQTRETPAPAVPAQTELAKGKGKTKMPDNSDIRTLWIRCHPSVYEDVLATVHVVVKEPLYNVSDGAKVTIEVADLRDRFNIFDLVGPKSSQVIHGALDPVKSEGREEFRKVCSYGPSV